MLTVKQLRQRDMFTHIWNNHSLLRKLLTYMYMQDNYVITRYMTSNTELVNNMSNNVNTVWDYCLDVCTTLWYGTLA